MYPYSWTWSYTLLAVCVLLALFVLGCTVLLLRKGTRSTWHRSPQSIATPLGCQSYWTQETMKLAAPGVARARQRDYYVKGRE
jgi:hypothetical protein